MIQETLELIRRRLNGHLSNLYVQDEDWVILSNVSGHDGQLYEAAKNKIVMFLANITHETTVSTYRPVQKKAEGSYIATRPPLYIDLFVIFYANFYDRGYAEGLRMISNTISFFQMNPYFDHASMPELAPSIDRLTLSLTNVDLLDVNHLMAMMGTKYLPSVYYKIRMLPFDSDAMVGAVPVARGAGTASRPSEAS